MRAQHISPSQRRGFRAGGKTHFCHSEALCARGISLFLLLNRREIHESPRRLRDDKMNYSFHSLGSMRHLSRLVPHDSTINSDLRLHFRTRALAQWALSSTDFSLWILELARTKPHRLKSVLLEPMTARHEKAAILIVEDEAKMRRLLELRLGEEGFVVHSAADAETGLQLLVREKPDLVVTDLRLPGMSGLEFLQAVKRANAELPVV